MRHATWSVRATALLSLALLLAAAAPALARPKIREAFFAAYPGAVGSRLDNLPSHAGHCGVCHYDFSGGGTRNPYGARVEAAINASPACNTNDVTCTKPRILGVGGEDSDGDGYTQNVEITSTTYSNTPTFPGLTPANVGLVANVTPSDLSGFLVPTLGTDTQPPTVTVTAPNGGESWSGPGSRTVTWTAGDNVGVAAVDVYVRDAEAAPWAPIGRNLANSGSLTWFVPNLPTAAARVRVVARDAAGNTAEDMSNALFTIVRPPGGLAPTTLRDFTQPGSEPLTAGTFETSPNCIACHGGYDSFSEPGYVFKGTMMAQAMRDPLFLACLAVAEQDAPSAGDLCLRCHTPFGWLSGRSTPTSGAAVTASDRDGVACDFCHRVVDPIYKSGTSPAADATVLGGMLAAHVPTSYANGQYVVDANTRKRGPFGDAVAPHVWLQSPFHSSSELCGTCHDVSNPVFDRVGAADYAPNAFGAPADSIRSATLMPLERTYSEWKASAFPLGVYAPEFAGNKPGGIVATCQDCHLRDVTGYGANDPAAPLRTNLPLHDMAGGNTWMGPVIAALYPGETDLQALTDGAARAGATLRKAASVTVGLRLDGGTMHADVTVTNRTGHKLPTGYPEGRRMWIELSGYDAAGTLLCRSGAYDAATGVLTIDDETTVYEAHLGLSPALAGALGLAAGPSFHFALNDTLYKDNRIPPAGFTNAAFAAFGGQPVDDTRPGTRYPDGQNWDVATYVLPAGVAKVVARLWYQSTSKDYVDFLRAANTTTSQGEEMYAAWSTHGRTPPVLMTADSTTTLLAVGPVPAPRSLALTAVRNPFGDVLEARLELPRAVRVAYDVLDARGRLVARRDAGVRNAGSQRIAWDGTADDGAAVPPGVYWLRVTAGDERSQLKVVRVR